VDIEQKLDELQAVVLDIANKNFSGALTLVPLAGARTIVVKNEGHETRVILSHTDGIWLYNANDVLITLSESLDRSAILERIENAFRREPRIAIG
jgi:hypothetical protein